MAAKKLKAWSYSRYNTYKKCPRQAYYRFIERRPEPEAPPLLRGQRVHDEAERYVKGELDEPTNELSGFASELDRLREARANGERVLLEEGWAFNKDYLPVHEDIPNKEFNPQTRLRVKVDALYQPTDDHAEVIDYKTGKVREEEHEEQLELYAPAAFLRYPSLQAIDAEMWYLDDADNHILSLRYTRDQLDELLRTWDERTAAMLEDTTFEPDPGPHCKWCNFSHNHANGPCEVG